MPAIGYQNVMAILFPPVAWTILTITLLILERVFTPVDKRRPSPIGSCILLGASISIVISALIAAWLMPAENLEAPRSQRNTSTELLVFHMGASTALTWIIGSILSALVGFVRIIVKREWRMGWLAAGLLGYAVAMLVMQYGPRFLPTA